jgi:hypothetical protein
MNVRGAIAAVLTSSILVSMCTERCRGVERHAGSHVRICLPRKQLRAAPGILAGAREDERTGAGAKLKQNEADNEAE